MTRGFLLGKFMPPHAGHVYLVEAAQRLVDQLTILVCWLPDDPIPGPLRLEWMRSLFPGARVLGHGQPVPQTPAESTEFWPIWRGIVAAAHPEPIDLVFAGEDYGLRMAQEVGGRFVPIGTRAEPRTPGPVSGTAIRADPWAHWHALPHHVRPWYARSICLHGPESTGKTTLARALADHFDTIWVPEYGRLHCETHGLDLAMDDLLEIGRVQSAMVAAALPWCNRRLIVDTDALMTAAWAEMLFGAVPDALTAAPRADLYLLLEPDVAWIDDGTRFFGDGDRRARFAAAGEKMLAQAPVNCVRIGGEWAERLQQAVAAIEVLRPN